MPLDLAGDGGDGVALEGAPVRFEPVDRLHQTEGRDLLEVLDGLAAVAEPAGDPVGHGQPGGDEFVSEYVPLRPVLECGQTGEEGDGVGGVVVPAPCGGACSAGAPDWLVDISMSMRIRS